MKFQSYELPLAKPQPRRKASKLAPLVALIVFLTIPLYYPSLRDSTKKLTEKSEIYQELEDSITLTSNAETPPIHQKLEDSITLTSNVETPPIQQELEDSITLPSNVENPPTSEDAKEPCSSGCNEEKGGGDTVVDHRVKKKRAKAGRRKRVRRESKRHPISRSANPMDSSSAGENRMETISASSDRGMIRSQLLDDDQCDLFSGQWVPNPDGTDYTNDTCYAIQEHQNCLKFGRPDTGFLKWRWKPDDCELPRFNPIQFLELVRGKSIAFVGDSVARNHMQSLICLLSKVAYPVDLSEPVDQNRRYEYREHDFNISMFWAPYLVRTERSDPEDDKRPFKLYLDEYDQHWTTRIALFDYVIISAGHWFFRPTYFYVDGNLTGCLYCPESNVAHLTSYFSYRRAFRTAFRAINDADFKGAVFLRTFAPSHFEGGPWDKGGNCARTAPYRKNEIALEGFSLEMYLIQLEELRIAQKTGRRNGGRFRLFDATGAMLLRPDGHPSKYGHWPVANQSFANDCVHWCLPGPIDSWNDFLQELLKRESGDTDTG